MFFHVTVRFLPSVRIWTWWVSRLWLGYHLRECQMQIFTYSFLLPFLCFLIIPPFIQFFLLWIIFAFGHATLSTSVLFLDFTWYFWKCLSMFVWVFLMNSSHLGRWFFTFLIFFYWVLWSIFIGTLQLFFTWTFDFISFERVVKAFSTLTASLAEVSKNLMPKDSAKVFPSSVLTCLFDSRSDLLPTSNLTTF